MTRQKQSNIQHLHDRQESRDRCGLDGTGLDGFVRSQLQQVVRGQLLPRRWALLFQIELCVCRVLYGDEGATSGMVTPTTTGITTATTHKLLSAKTTTCVLLVTPTSNTEQKNTTPCHTYRTQTTQYGKSQVACLPPKAEHMQTSKWARCACKKKKGA